MPSTSPGIDQDGAIPTTPSTFAQILPGQPTDGYQSLVTFPFRQKRYIAYITGQKLNILTGPETFLHAIDFEEELVLVAAEESSSKVAVASRERVWVFEPAAEGWTKVRWEKSLLLQWDGGSDEARTLSWGSEGELLVGGCERLKLFSTLPSSRSSSPSATPIDVNELDERRPLWAKDLPNPLQHCAFSPSATLIATCARYDRFVKIWRRLSFEEGLFDYSYLPHPTPITYVQWRPLDHTAEERRGSGIARRDDDDLEVLYTMASDGILRIWRTGGPHDLEIMILHTSINLVDAIPQSPSITAKGSGGAPIMRYAFIVPSAQFGGAVSAALAAAVGILNDGKVSHALEHLKEVSSKEPDVVVTLDGHGRMSAWGLQCVGHKRRPDTPGSKEPFHIAHAESLPLRFSDNANFEFWFEDDKLNLLAQSFGGTDSRSVRAIDWWKASAEAFFSPSIANEERLHAAARWTGNSSTIARLTGSGTDVLTSTKSSRESTSWHLAGTNKLEARSAGQSIDDKGLPNSPLPTWLETGIEEASVSAKNDGFAAVAYAKQLVLLDLQEGYIEYEQSYKATVRFLQFADTPGGDLGILAVGFETHVDVLLRGRYRTGSTWERVKQVSIAGLGFTINGVVWLKHLALCIAAGNGLIVESGVISSKCLRAHLRESLDLVISQDAEELSLGQITGKLSRPSSIWHPEVLTHLILSGHLPLVIMLFKRLQYKLKFYSEGDELDSLLDLSLHDMFEQSIGGQSETFNAEVADSLWEQLDEQKLPGLSRTEQDSLKLVVQATTFVVQHRDALDVPALRYLFSWRLQVLQLQELAKPVNGSLTNGTSHATNTAPKMAWREITFAYHSKTQQPLLDLLLVHHDNKLNWETSGSLGVMRWLSEPEARAQIFETIAQSEYRSSQPPDPVDATLFYLALRKKQTLLALWRIATWHREQRSTMSFLRRDFTQPEARTAAKKNAYALMGKRRFKYAAAFFLLADDPGSATSLLAGQCEDIPLAVAVARLYSGDGSPEICGLLENRVLPKASEEGNRWLLSWANSVMGRKHEAADALMKPLNGIRRWQQDDPLTLLLYRQLRTGHSEHEWTAVLRAARVLRRMGLTIIAFELLSSWTFAPPPQATPQPHPVSNGAMTNGISPDQPKSVLGNLDSGVDTPSKGLPSALDGFMTPDPVASKPADEKSEREAKAAELLKKLQAKKSGAGPAASNSTEKDDRAKKPAPTQFKEPTANSLLDSFGL